MTTISTINIAAFAGVDDIMLTQFAAIDYNTPELPVYYSNRRAPATPDRTHCLLTKQQAVRLLESIGEHATARTIETYLDNETHNDNEPH